MRTHVNESIATFKRYEMERREGETERERVRDEREKTEN